MRALLERLNGLLHGLLALTSVWLIASSPWLGLYHRLPEPAGALNLSHVVLGLARLDLHVLIGKRAGDLGQQPARQQHRALVLDLGGEARPREGVPFAVKDLFDSEGVRTAYGSPMFAGHVPERDAEALARARAAGAILVGKTQTHEFAWGITSVNELMGSATVITAAPEADIDVNKQNAIGIQAIPGRLNEQQPGRKLVEPPSGLTRRLRFCRDRNQK